MAKFDGTCLHCHYFDFDFGEPDYSEMTPGSPGHMLCWKKHFNYYCGDDVPTLREVFYRNIECKDFMEDER